MPNILLININNESTPYPVFPIGVWTLKKYLEQNGVDVDVADVLMLGGWEAIEEQFLKLKSYDWAGLSLRNIDDLSWPEVVDYVPTIQGYIDQLKTYFPADRIVLGGAGYSIFGDVLRKHLGLTYGVSGDGEEKLLTLITGKTHGAEPADFSYATHVPSETLQFYYQEGGMLGIQTRRGCCYNCSYCTYPTIEGRSFRKRDIDNIIAELRYLTEQEHIDTFYFVDCIFNVPETFTQELLQALIDSNLKIRWYAFINPGYINEEMVGLLKRSGCAGLEIGSESGADITLQSLNKDYTTDDILTASRLCKEASIKFCHYLMLGAPGETEETVIESIELMKRCDPSTVIISTGIRIYPNTPLYNDLFSNGQCDHHRSLLEPVFYEPEAIGLKKIVTLCAELCPSHWVYPGQKESLNTDKMTYLRKRGIKGPLWDYL